MKRIAFLAASMLFLTGCGTNADSSNIQSNDTTVQSSIPETSLIVNEQETTKATVSGAEITDVTEAKGAEKESEPKLQIEVNGHTLTATLADNEAAKALAELIMDAPLTLKLREYGSFEKVGPLPQSLPANDESITTEPGDIMLYVGNQITIFYGSNTWSYTRLGKIDNVTQSELKEIFGEGDVTVTFSLTK